MRKVAGMPYVYQRGDRYLVRVQVPAAAQGALGRTELKKSLGGDLTVVRRKHHQVVAEFLRLIEGAKGSEPAVPAAPSVDAQMIDQAAYAYFARMVPLMRGRPVADDRGDEARSRTARLNALREMLELHLDALDGDDHSIMAMQAGWLCDEHGWALDPAGALFGRLCERMLRARIEFYRDEMRRLQGNFAERTDADPLFGSRPPKPSTTSLTLGDLVDRFNAEREARWSTSTKKNYVIITRVIEEVCGRGTPINEVDKEFCRRVRDVLITLPSSYQKKPATKGRPIAEVIEIARATGMPLIEPATINAHLMKLGAIIRFGRDDGLITGNPMAGIKVHDPVLPGEKRDPFSPAQLQKIFTSEPWRSGTLRPGGKPSRFWVPLLALFTGARVGELCGLRVDEVRELDGLPIIAIADRDDRRTKSRRSRLVPVHPALQQIGFLDFVSAEREAGKALLFPEEKANTLDHWGDAVSDWFGRLIKPLDFQGRKLSMHSFRHNFEDALRDADLHDTPIGNYLTGRSTRSISANYGTPRPSGRKLAAAIEQIAYPRLNLSHLLGIYNRVEPASA